MVHYNGSIIPQVLGGQYNYKSNIMYKWILILGCIGTVNAQLPKCKKPAISVLTSWTVQLPNNSLVIPASATDSNGSAIASYQWSGNNGTGTGLTTPTLTLTGLSAGTAIWSLLVKDSCGASNTATVNITVKAAKYLVTARVQGSSVTLFYSDNSSILITRVLLVTSNVSAKTVTVTLTNGKSTVYQ